VVLTEDMRELVLGQRLGFHATVSPDGRPNLSPKGTTTVFDDTHLMFAHIYSPQTVANLRRNPAIEVNVVDPILRRGYRFRGRASVHETGELYERGLTILAERGYGADRERIHAVIVIAVEAAEELLSPAYDSGATEREVATPWRERLLARLES
jgi:predicted pyridoxine 5'-phosphate oxidase superfamily flavin-nucleotide-binding protein